MVVLARVFDAVSDPLIGIVSDRLYSKTGSRKLLILVGGALYIMCSYFLYAPPEWESGLGGGQAITVYFACWLFAFYLAWTLFEVPHISWGSELAVSANEKTKVYSFRSVAGYSGVVLFYSIPMY